MPDWSYRTILRPMLLALGERRAQRIATGVLARIGRFPFGPALIDFLGHMDADARLGRDLAGLRLRGPIVLGGMIDPEAAAVRAFGRFGAGLIETGPVRERGETGATEWRVDLHNRTVTLQGEERAVGVEIAAANSARATVPVCVRIVERDPPAIGRVAARLAPHAAAFNIDAHDMDGTALAAAIAAARDVRPVLVRVSAGDARIDSIVSSAIAAGAAGIWLVAADAGTAAESVPRVRGVWPNAIVVAGGVIEPEDARRLLDAGADCAIVDAGLILSGPGLIKRCNEALLSRAVTERAPEGLSFDAARRAWLWAFLLGIGMLGGGVLASIIASTRVVLPYDEALCGLTRDQLATLNPRLLPFMAHDRVSLAGTMISIGIFYAALAWFGIRRGVQWAHVTVIASAASGFFTFFLFLGFGYFDPFHAFVTAILTQFTLLCAVMQRSPRQPEPAEWRESPAWRRAQWGQLLFVIIGVGLIGAGAVLSIIGSTFVFVRTDLEFMRTTAAQLALSYERLIPLVAHDRASLGGMLIANGIVVLLSALWGFRAGARWLWQALAWGGTVAFALALLVHLVVGYDDLLHLAPAAGGWALWTMALLLTREWMVREPVATAQRVSAIA